MIMMKRRHIISACLKPALLLAALTFQTAAMAQREY